MDTTTSAPTMSELDSVTIPTSLWTELSSIARRDGRSVDDVIRTALEIYAERVVTLQVRTSAGTDEGTVPSRAGTSGDSDDERLLKDGANRFASLGAGESADDGFDTTNHEEWLKKHWRLD